MKNLSFKLSAIILSAVLLTGCGRKVSSPDAAIVRAHEVYGTMAIRYDHLLRCTPMSQECLQELRVHGVHRDKGWFEGDANRSTPLLRVESILVSDLAAIDTALYNLRKFGLHDHSLHAKLKAMYEKLNNISEQLPVQKEYIDEHNTRKTHGYLTSLLALNAVNPPVQTVTKIYLLD